MDVVGTVVYPVDLSGFSVPRDKRFWIFNSREKERQRREDTSVTLVIYSYPMWILYRHLSMLYGTVLIA